MLHSSSTLNKEITIVVVTCGVVVGSGWVGGALVVVAAVVVVCINEDIVCFQLQYCAIEMEKLPSFRKCLYYLIYYRF